MPADAPQDYADPSFIVRHYEESLPADELSAFVQVTLRFGHAPNLHHPYGGAGMAAVLFRRGNGTSAGPSSPCAIPRAKRS